MSALAQDSPFSGVGEGVGKGKVNVKEGVACDWDEVTVMLIQRRFGEE